MFRAFLNFDNFLFPKLTVVIYWIGLVLIILGGIVGIIGALVANNLLGVLLAIVGAAVAVVIWRITIELWMVLFSIYDVLRDIRDQRRARHLLREDRIGMRPDLAEADPASLLRQLIRCPSVTPEPAGVLDLLRDRLVALGFAVELVAFEGDGSYRVENLFATRGEAGPHLLFAGHTDVVPPGDAAAWTHPPFAAEEADGRLYGRGAADMKSGIAAFVAAAATAIRAGEAETGRISLAITNDEEADGINGTEKLMAWAAERGRRFDFAIVGEPSSAVRVGDSIKIGRRGSLNAEITVAGIQGHVAYPEKARNPLPLLAEIVTGLSGALDAGSTAFPPSNLEFTSLDVGNPVSNVIPGAGRARLNIRYNDGWTPESLAGYLRARLAEIAGPAAALAVLGRPSRSFVSPTGGALDLLADTIAAETGSRPEFSTGGGTSDARFIAPYCPVAELGIVGPTMHQVDESIALADLAALTAIYRRFIARFLSPV